MTLRLPRRAAPGSSRLTDRAVRTRIVGALLWVVALYLSLGGLVLHNDHFDRISRARQLARFGELPFRDFFDPGYFGSVLASAALQRLLGDNLLGELLLNAAFIATGTVLVLHLATRLSRSSLIGIAAALLALLTMPRAYDYDKVLFFPLGVALCWRYLDTRRPRDLVLLAIALVCGAVFRYDTGVYIGGGAIAAVVAAHAHDRRTMARRAGLLAASVAAAAAPALLFVALQGGLPDAVDQVATYARREAARTRIAAPPAIAIEGPLLAFGRLPSRGIIVNVRWAEGITPQLRQELEARYHLSEGRIEGPAENPTWVYAIEDPSTANVRALVDDPLVDDTHYIDRTTFELTNAEPLSSRIRRQVPWLRVEIVPGLWESRNAAPILYYLLILIPLAAAAVLLVRRRQPDIRHDAPYIWCLLAVCVLLDIFILREPIQARVGGMAGPAAVTAAWLWSRVRSRLAAVPLVAALVVVVWSVSVVGEWRYSVVQPMSDWRHVSKRLTEASQTPPPLSLLQTGRLAGVVTYLRDCTSERDRVFVASFLPEISFFAQRGFAGGMAVTFGGHWSEPRFQRRSIDMLTRQPAALVLLPDDDMTYLSHRYPFVMEHLRTRYLDAGTSAFGSAEAAARFRVLVPRARRPQRTHAATGLPCF